MVQKSEIEWLEGMKGVGKTNTKCCGGGTINMCSPCGVCFCYFWQCLFLLFPANAAYAAQYKGRTLSNN